MQKLNSKLLVQEFRSNLLELEFYGYVIFCDKNKNIKTYGNTENHLFFHRSCSKPLQASLMCLFNTDKYFDFTDEEIAVCCASHTGTPVHTELVNNILRKINLSVDDLQCPAIEPLSSEEQKKFDTYSKLHNNCSGKHALMLAICRQNSWDIKNYLDKNHPLQIAVYEQIKSLCETKYDMPYTPDGCGAPNWATTLEDFSKGFYNLFFDEKYSRLKHAYMKNPFVSGGDNRLDSQIMQLNTKLAVKVGAGGLCYVSNTETNEVLGFKIVDANMQARSIAVIETLMLAGWIDKNSIDKKLLNNSINNFVKTETGEIVGKYELCEEAKKQISQMF